MPCYIQINRLDSLLYNKYVFRSFIDILCLKLFNLLPVFCMKVTTVLYSN